MCAVLEKKKTDGKVRVKEVKGETEEEKPRSESSPLAVHQHVEFSLQRGTRSLVDLSHPLVFIKSYLTFTKGAASATQELPEKKDQLSDGGGEKPQTNPKWM